MMKKITLFIAFLFASFMFPQEISMIDSLVVKLKTTVDEDSRFEILEKIINTSNDKFIKVKDLDSFYTEYIEISKSRREYKKLIKCYLNISENYLKLRQKKLALKYVDSATQFNNILNSNKNKILLINKKGRIYEAFDEYQEAIKNFQEIYAIDSIYSNYNGIACNVICNIGVSEKKLGNSLKSIKYYLEALECLELNPNPQIYNFVISHIGWTYMDLEKYSLAEKFYLDALEKVSINENEFYTADLYRSMAINYSRWGKYIKAVEYNRYALEMFTKQGRLLLVYDVNENLAITYARLEKFHEAELYSREALKIANEINYDFGISGSKLTLAQILLNQNKLNQADKYLNDIDKDSSNTRFRQVLMSSYLQTSSELHEKLGNSTKALIFHKRFKSFSDSIISEAKEKEIIEIEKKYNIEKKEKELSNEREEKQKLEYKNLKLYWYLIASFTSAILIIIISLLSYRSFKLKREAEIQKKSNQILSLENEMAELTRKQKESKLKIRESFDQYLKNTYRITDKMLEFWKLQSQGYIEKEIAELLSLKESGVETRRNSLYTKLFQKTRRKYNRNNSIGLYLNEIMKYYDYEIQNMKMNTTVKP